MLRLFIAERYSTV